jgi:hypothetical protein
MGHNPSLWENISAVRLPSIPSLICRLSRATLELVEIGTENRKEFHFGRAFLT